MRLRMGPRVRMTVVSLAVSVAFYAALAHGLGAMPMDQGTAMHGVGICVVLLAVGTGTLAAVASVGRSRPRELIVQVRLPLALRPAPRVYMPSRASPAWLQCFLR